MLETVPKKAASYFVWEAKQQPLTVLCKVSLLARMRSWLAETEEEISGILLGRKEVKGLGRALVTIENYAPGVSERTRIPGLTAVGRIIAEKQSGTEADQQFFPDAVSILLVLQRDAEPVGHFVLEDEVSPPFPLEAGRLGVSGYTVLHVPESLPKPRPFTTFPARVLPAPPPEEVSYRFTKRVWLLGGALAFSLAGGAWWAFREPPPPKGLEAMQAAKPPQLTGTPSVERPAPPPEPVAPEVKRPEPPPAETSAAEKTAPETSVRAKPAPRQQLARVELSFQPAPESKFRRGMGKIPGLGAMDRSRSSKGSQFVPAKLVRPLTPKVPEELAAKSTTPVKLEVSISKLGRVRSIKTLSRRTDSRLANLATDSLYESLFSPARLNGREVDSRLIVTVRLLSPEQAQ